MSTRASFQCHFPGCGLSYRRKEHLTRHARRHFQSDSFECPFCDRRFARNDTLRQHVRTHHEDKQLQPGRTIRACNYCCSRKSKCDGKAPCGACVRRGIDCSLGCSSRGRQVQQASRAGSPTAGPVVDSTNLVPVHNLDAIEHSPSRALIYIQVFFEKFHSTWPFLHRATFDPDHEPALLLQSVMMMGLWLTGKEDARRAATDLHSKLLVSIHQQRDKWEAPSPHNAEPPSPWPMATYQGILLQIIFALLQGNQGLNLQLTHELPTLPLQLLKALVRTCLERQMFFYPSIVAQFKNTLPDVYIWVGVEEVKRFALALYKVCRSCRVPDIGASSQGRSLLSLANLQFAPPDSDELWHASSDLASRLAEDRSAYGERNSDARWISQTASVLQPDGGFCWF
ncbi:putative C6 and C2H2 transcription factor [Aspergillus nomiae NRRL 13137]|uniref:Putative C6 and C2H2 transcription factor n=1 Tax=Aspergillus nomiae NRRL (strain ATCC 15546 / NRRL 13137 / CBS 260.88 / M93) TaxID=1509407 RepID=A0A0L1IL85_ASPN3|nr:putative C6 and C2H2 transcription factor [Aspergillus nomiae NRRL 13137]KNG80344.1 putative C6 and C2H2 transcription factor [Aspergillus nomiae NRRL 13137]